MLSISLLWSTELCSYIQEIVSDAMTCRRNLEIKVTVVILIAATAVAVARVRGWGGRGEGRGRPTVHDGGRRWEMMVTLYVKSLACYPRQVSRAHTHNMAVSRLPQLPDY